MNILRRSESVVADWRADPKVVAAHKRLAELDAFLANASDRLARHDGIIADATRELERAEVEVLAGRSTDAALAKVQAKHMELRRARAKDLIAAEDAQAEASKLTAALPGLERNAKQASHDAIQTRGVALLKEMRAAISVLAQAEGDYSGLVQDAENQFPIGVSNPHETQYYDPNFATRAGLHILRDSRMNGYRRESVSLDGATARFMVEIEELLEQLAAK